MEAVKTLPCPVFEGSEKRLEVDFYAAGRADARGLRCLARSQLDALLDEASCSIVSVRQSADFDAYLLSESSMMVYPTKLVLKTCGTTRLLAAVPRLLELASTLGMPPRRCKYSRASYLFPELQPDLYRCFTREASFLDAFFGDMHGKGGSFVLGDAAHGLQWHIYVADAEAAPAPIAPQPTYSLEICMTELCPSKAAQFVRGPDFVSAAHTTAASGVGSLLRGAAVDDYVFEPCGYSMNGVEGGAFSTVHVTPEEACSYASFELSGYPPQRVSPAGVLAKVAKVFRPGRLTVSLSVDEDVPENAWLDHVRVPPGYSAEGSAAQRFACGGRVVLYTLSRAAGKARGDAPGSPSTVLDGIFGVHNGEDSDRDGATEDSSRSASPSPGEDALATVEKAGLGVPDALRKVVRDHGAALLDSGGSAAIEQHMVDLIRSRDLEDPLYVIDLGRVARLFEGWRAALPRVTPFYAVKCLTDDAVIATLAALGAGFDCASQAEMEAVVRLGVSADRIMLANACKRPKDVRSAVALGVALTTFDTEGELRKLAAGHPAAAAVLRIRADDPGARCILGNKYGAEPEHVTPLLQAAKSLGVNVVGVSFHVGSLASDPAVFGSAIAWARDIFDEASRLGFSMDLLDIGGGFSAAGFEAGVGASIPVAVGAALDAHFPDGCGVRIISEPGRYFVEDAATLACMVFGVRDSALVGDGEARRDYWITDGLYGSMNSLLYDHAVLAGVHPLLALRGSAAAPSPDAGVLSNVFGPTCDGLDVVLKEVRLPPLESGDWLVFPAMGAYTLAGACNFNGMGVSAANASYVYSSGV